MEYAKLGIIDIHIFPNIKRRRERIILPVSSLQIEQRIKQRKRGRKEKKPSKCHYLLLFVFEANSIFIRINTFFLS